MDEKALWERAVQERPDAASRFGPPAWLVKERQRGNDEPGVTAARLRAEYGLGEPQPMSRPTSYTPTRQHPPSHIEGECTFCNVGEDVGQAGSPTLCPTCGTRPKDGRHRECYVCRRPPQRQDTTGAAPS